MVLECQQQHHKLSDVLIYEHQMQSELVFFVELAAGSLCFVPGPGLHLSYFPMILLIKNLKIRARKNLVSPNERVCFILQNNESNDIHHTEETPFYTLA